MRDLGLDPCQQKPRSLWVSACFHCQVEGRRGRVGAGQGRARQAGWVVMGGGGGGILLQLKGPGSCGCC